MIKDSGLISAKDFKVGLYTRSDIINPNPDLSPNCMDIKWYFDDVIGKRLGSSTTNTITLGSSSTAMWTIDSSGSLSSNLQSYWKLDEPSGSRSDSFNTNNLSDINSTPSIVGIRGLAALMVATNSNYLVTPTVSSLETGNINFSISSWVYLNSTDTTVNRTIVSKRDPDVDIATVLLLHCDGTDASTSFPDSSPANHTVTAGGNCQVDTAQFKFGTGSALFDGNGDYLTSADSPDWDFSTGNFTIDFWVRFNTTGNNAFIDRGNGVNGYTLELQGGGALAWAGGGAGVKTETWTPSTGTWYHIAVVKVSSTLHFYIDGTELGSGTSDSNDYTYSTDLFIGQLATGIRFMDGWMDEIRITKGIARWTSNFTPPTRAYAVNDYEYWLFVNSNNLATFNVSSSGSNPTATVQATSLGALNTSTWYNIVAWHSNNSHIGIEINNGAATTAAYTLGVRVGSAPFALGAQSDSLQGFATSYADSRIDEVGFWKKVLDTNDRSNLYGGGSGNTYSGGQAAFGWYSFDFGASGVRWYTICVGTGIVASSNLGTNFVTVTTSRTQTYQYLDRSKNVLIATSDAYDPTLYWAGSAGTTAATLAPNSAPLAKFSVNYQGFCVLLNFANSNGTIRNRGFAYADENLQLTDTWQNSFDLPSSADDEITGPFILNKFLYVSTKYRIFRLNYTGGNPDWQYIQVKNFGYVPRTVKVFTLKQGQVAVGLDWSRRLRAFDGYDDQILSDNVENDNDYCDFAMQKISLAGSGLLVSNAEFDPNAQEYRLNLAIGAQSTQTTHSLVLNARTLAIYPYSNQPFNTICVAESAGRQFLMAVGRSGFVHILNSGNLDVATPINDIYDSPLLFKKSPVEVSKNKQINFFFSHDSCGTLYYQERFDFSNTFSSMRPIRNVLGEAELTGNESSLQIIRTVDLPSVQNVYQFRLTSSAGTANPWKLTHFDLLNTSLGFGRGG